MFLNKATKLDVFIQRKECTVLSYIIQGAVELFLKISETTGQKQRKIAKQVDLRDTRPEESRKYR